MKPAKYSIQDAQRVDLKTKIIAKYPTPTKKMDIAKMTVKGRHPEKENYYVMDKKCNFVIYILNGSGTIYAGDEIFEVKKEDVVFVPQNNKYAVRGNFEYITIDAPAFYPEQFEEIET